MTKPLAKSLHTVTVLTRVAGYLMNCHDSRQYKAVPSAVDKALAILGYHDAPDVYGLREAAIMKLDPTYSAPVREPTPAELQAEWNDQVAREEREADRCIDVSFK